MNSWNEVTVGEVCRLNNGRAYKQKELLERGTYPVLRVGNFFSNRSWYYSDLELEDSKYCDDGDLLYAWSASFGPRIWDGGKVIYHYHIWRVDNDPAKIDKRFLYHWFNWDVARLRAEQGTGATMIHITKTAMENRRLRLPPLSEQKRIADILDKADAIRRKRTSVLCEVEILSRGVFRDLFGDTTKNDRHWPVVRVDEVGEVQLGRQRAPKYQTGKHTHSYLRVANVFEDRLALSDVLTMDFDEQDFERYQLRDGDILLNEGQSTELVGRPAIWRSEIADCCFQNTLVRFRADADKVDEEYALGVFLDFLRRGAFARLSSKTSSVAHLGAARFAAMQFPVPPRSLQSQYGDFRRDSRKVVAKYRDGVTGANDLFNSLVQRAFKGEL